VNAAPRLGRAAAGMFRELGMPFPLGATLLERGEWLVGQGRASEAGPLLTEARDIFDRLKAPPWLERLEATQSRVGRSPAEITA
jgi:hypothetical protein